MVQVIFTIDSNDSNIRVSLGTEVYNSLFDLLRETQTDVVDRQGVFANAVDARTGEVIGKTHVYMESDQISADGHVLKGDETIKGIRISTER